MCLICDAENQYLRQGENCEYCEAGKADDLGAWAFLIVCCFLLMIVVFLGISCTTVVRGMDKEREHLKHVNRDSIKILIGYMQVLSVMTVSYSSVQWPSGFKSYSQGMSVVNFDLAFLMPIASCSLAVSYRTKLFIHLVTPIASALSILIGFKIAVILNLTLCKKKQSDKERAREAKWTQADIAEAKVDRFETQSNKMGTYIINLGLLMYPGLTTRIFSVFRCFKVQGVGWFLEKDFSIQCFDSSTHQTLLALGVAGLVVYVAGFPLFLLFEMGRNLEHLHVKDPALKNALESHNARSKASEEIVELKLTENHEGMHKRHMLMKERLGTLFRSYEVGSFGAHHLGVFYFVNFVFVFVSDPKHHHLFFHSRLSGGLK